MRSLVSLVCLLIFCGCGDKTTLQLSLQFPDIREEHFSQYIQNVQEYEILFRGNFGEKRTVVNRSNGPIHLEQDEIPFDDQLIIIVNVRGRGFDGVTWTEPVDLAHCEAKPPIRWYKGRKDPATIQCLLSEIGKATYEQNIIHS
ncbi:MAG TPA: hypothetical protein VJL87_01860 [Bdellovibrionota bacterium]|nr:hypothetical protein [Bdellovibrionota bacterium]